MKARRAQRLAASAAVASDFRAKQPRCRADQGRRSLPLSDSSSHAMTRSVRGCSAGEAVGPSQLWSQVKAVERRASFAVGLVTGGLG